MRIHQIFQFGPKLKLTAIASSSRGAVQFTDSLPVVLIPLTGFGGTAMGLFSQLALRLANALFPDDRYIVLSKASSLPCLLIGA